MPLACLLYILLEVFYKEAYPLAGHSQVIRLVIYLCDKESVCQTKMGGINDDRGTGRFINCLLHPFSISIPCYLVLSY